MMKLMSMFVLILLIFTSCSRKSEQELAKEGREQEQQKNFALAIERYKELVERYPTTALAESVQYRVAILYHNELHDIRGAVGAYLTFHDLFPNSSNAPTSLFLAGFLMNNDLHNLDSAKILYESFLQKYPNHDLAKSAKFELATLGKDPGIILQQNGEADEKTPPMSSGKAVAK